MTEDEQKARLQQLADACRRFLENFNEFGTITDSEYINDIYNAIPGDDIDTGGYAFPHSYANGQYVTDGGMTLRDWFAGQALASMAYTTPTLPDADEMAAWAYQYADAMLKERDKRKADEKTVP